MICTKHNNYYVIYASGRGRYLHRNTTGKIELIHQPDGVISVIRSIIYIYNGKISTI